MKNFVLFNASNVIRRSRVKITLLDTLILNMPQIEIRSNVPITKQKGVLCPFPTETNLENIANALMKRKKLYARFALMNKLSSKKRVS